MDRRRAFLLALVATLLVMAVAFVLPFLDYFLLAVVLAYVLWPLQRRLGARVGETIAAGVIVLGATVTLVVPAVFVVRRTYAEAQRIVTQIREGEFTFGRVEDAIEEVVGLQVDVSETLRQTISDIGIGAFGDVISLVGTLTHVLIGIGLTLFLLFYFLRDGGDFVAWLGDRLPLEPDVIDELFEQIDRITWAVLAGHVFVAIVQGILAGGGLFATGVPNATFWTVVMIVLSLLPIIGSFLVWGPAAGWLFLTGEPIAAGALLFYGTIIVGISDDYLRPIVVDRYAKLSPAVIILGVLGGIYVIGFMGIFVGPIILGILRVTIDIYDRTVIEEA